MYGKKIVNIYRFEFKFEFIFCYFDRLLVYFEMCFESNNLVNYFEEWVHEYQTLQCRLENCKGMNLLSQDHFQTPNLKFYPHWLFIVVRG